MFKIVMSYPDGTTEEQEEVFETESQAHDYGQYLCSCYETGGEILHRSNPGDYPLDDNGEADYEIVEVPT